MKPTKLSDDLVPGPQIKVISIGEQDLDAQLLQASLAYTLDGARGTDGHEGRCLDNSVGGVKEACPRTSALVAGNNFKSQIPSSSSPRPDFTAKPEIEIRTEKTEVGDWELGPEKTTNKLGRVFLVPSPQPLVPAFGYLSMANPILPKIQIIHNPK